MEFQAVSAMYPWNFCIFFPLPGFPSFENPCPPGIPSMQISKPLGISLFRGGLTIPPWNFQKTEMQFVLPLEFQTAMGLGVPLEFQGPQQGVHG